MSKANFYHVTAAGKIIPQPSATKAIAASKQGGYAWLDYCEPSKEELLALIRPMGLHPLAIEDCFDTNQVPKIEDYPRHTFMLFNAFDYADHQLVIYELDVFIGRNFLVTVYPRDSKGRPILEAAKNHADAQQESIREGPAFLLHVILDHIVDDKFVEIEDLEEELITSEEAVLADTARFNPGELLHLRRDLLAVRKSLYYEREILVKLNRRDSPFVQEQAIYLYRDIYDHLNKFFELTESFRDGVTSLMEMYLSMLNNQMALAANQTNATVRRLTFITTIFMPLTLLAGVGGMSEFTMMTGQQNWRLSYPLFLLGMVVLAVATYFVLRSIQNRRTN
jgi:magnesium transporter